MGGFLGFGQSGQEKQSNTNLNNVFNYGLDTSRALAGRGTAAQDRALRDYGASSDFFRNLLVGGRPQARMAAAPAINAQLDQADTAKREAAEMGSGRTGGDTAANAEFTARNEKNIDDIINQNLFGGRALGAQGLNAAAGGEAAVGASGLGAAMQALGIGTGAQESTLDNAIKKQGQQTNFFSDVISPFAQGLAKYLF